MMKTGRAVRFGAAVLLLLVIPAAPAAAAVDGSGPCGQAAEREPGPTLEQAGRDFLHDAGRIWTSPLRVKARHVGPIVTLAAATAFLIAADEDIRDAVQDFAGRHPWADDVGAVVTEMGSTGALAAAGAFFGLGLILKDDRARETGYLSASAIAQTFLVDNVLKGLTGRQRPFVDDGRDHWSGPAGFFRRFDKDYEGLYSSFPSGHTATAFTLATVVALQYRHRAWVPVVAYAIASGVGLSRMTMDRHWASDVVAGALIGHLIARLVVRSHGRGQRLVPALACSRGVISLSIQYCPGPVDR